MPASRIKFQADADLDGRVIRGLRRAAPEIDIRSAYAAALKGQKDPDEAIQFGQRKT